MNELGPLMDDLVNAALWRYCEFQIAMVYNDEDQPVFEGTVSGDRGLNNSWVNPNLIDLVDEMTQWLRTAKEKPFPEQL